MDTSRIGNLQLKCIKPSYLYQSILKWFMIQPIIGGTRWAATIVIYGNGVITRVNLNDLINGVNDLINGSPGLYITLPLGVLYNSIYNW